VMWCSNAVNRATLSLIATCRTRSSALYTSGPALRPGRGLLAVFPLARPLSSPASAAMALFGGLAGTTGRSDCPCPFIPGVPPRRSLSGPPADQADGQIPALPVLAHEGSAHALVLRPCGVHRRLAKAPPVVLPSTLSTASAPRTSLSFRGSIARPPRALSNASPRPHGRRCMARGRRGSLVGCQATLRRFSRIRMRESR
jgi:hypothetical protein